LVRSKGAFDIKGMLNAGVIEIDLNGRSTAREIGGERIVVTKGLGSRLEELLRFVFLHPGALTVDVIEGDEVQLEQVIAKVVRGNRVVIGPGCEIDLVEHKGDYRKADGATVKEERRM
jgi:hypothetical protein